MSGTKFKNVSEKALKYRREYYIKNRSRILERSRTPENLLRRQKYRRKQQTKRQIQTQNQEYYRKYIIRNRKTAQKRYNPKKGNCKDLELNYNENGLIVLSFE